MPGWVENAIWWHVYPLGFVGAPPQSLPGDAVAHRLAHLQAWFDYAIELGANGLALGPVFASSTHGYDTVDYYRVDPRLGDDDDLDALIAAARGKGLRVLFDGVFNHVGRDHPAFQAVLEQGPGAPTASWFDLTWPDGAGPGTVPTYRDFEGHGQLVALNHASPQVEDLITDVMCHWLERGIDGWRLDAAYAVPPSLWARVLPRVRERFPEAYIVGEVIHGDYAGIVAESGMDAVTQYELWKATWSALNDGNFYELAHALERHDGFLETFVPFTFVGNHDVTRIASRLTDERHLAHALVVLFTVAGTPAVYYGDEQGYRGVKEERFGGDDQIRPHFPAHPGELSRLGEGVHALHQELIGLRRRHPWLHTARTATLHLSNTQFSYECRGAGGRLVVALNLADTAAAVPTPGAQHPIAGQARSGGAVTHLPAHGWAVLTG